MVQMILLGVHFLLELCALAAAAWWGFKTGGSGGMKFLLGVGVPLLLAVVWGVFRVPNEPGPAVVAVPGWLRLLIEWGVFAFAVWGLHAAGQPALARIFGAAVLLNYALMFPWVLRILARR